MQIVSPISGKTVDSFNIDEVMGMLAADWMMKLDAWRPSAASPAASAEPTLEFMNFLRV